MAKCSKQTEFTVVTDDHVGMLAEVTGVFAHANINIIGMSAYGMDGKAYFMIVTDNAEKSYRLLQTKGWQVEANDVIVVGMTDKVGSVQEIGEKLKLDNINVAYCYATTCTCAPGTCSPNCLTQFIVRTDNNHAALKALSI